VEYYKVLKKFIDEKKIEKLFSNPFLNRLKKYNITTTQDVMKMNITYFSSLKGMGDKKVVEFKRLKTLIEIWANNEEKTKQPLAQFNPVNAITQIPISRLKDSISTNLQNFFEKNKCQTIQDVFNLSHNKLSSNSLANAKTVNETKQFLGLVYNNPSTIILEALKYSHRELPKECTGDIITDINLFIIEFFNSITAKQKDILCRRYSLFENKKHTLEEIRTIYGLTRERIRQICTEYLMQIDKALNGKYIQKPFIFANNKLQTMYKKLKKKFSKTDFIIATKAKIIITQEFNSEIKIEGLFYFLFKILGFAKGRLKGVDYLFRKDKFGKTNFNEIAISITILLQETVKPISLADIHMKLNEKHGNVPEFIIKHALNFLSIIEQIQSGNTTLYQIKFHELKSLKGVTLRILMEKNEVMHFKEIFKEMQRRSKKHQRKKHEAIKSVQGQMVLDDRLKPIGRTGRWTLTEWNMNTQAVIDLVIDAFKIINKPCTVKEIIKQISTIRPDVGRDPVSSVLFRHRKYFRKINRETYILEKWKKSYPSAVKVGEGTDVIKIELLGSYFKKIFATSKTKTLLLSEIKKRLEEFDIYWPSNYCQTKFANSPYLSKKKKGNRNLYSYKDYTPKEKPQYYGKLKKLKDKIIQYIQNSAQQPIPLREIIYSLEEQGEIRSNIYGIISHDPKLFKKEMTNNKKYISLKKLNP